jgi:hypothetical protein
MRLPLRFLLLTCAAVSLVVAAGCSDQEYVTPENVVVPAPAIQLSPVAPPAPSDEIVEGLTDPRTQIWRHGHWEYDAGHFNWFPGEVLTRPSPTAIWSEDRWEHRVYGWAFIHGYWQ